jgi:hypothetical protein
LSLPKEWRDLLPFLNKRELAQVDALLATVQEAAPSLWTPNPPKPGSTLPNPQALALASKADVTGFGGSAGGGKTDLLLGAAITQHHRSIIFRREGVQLKAMVERSHELLDGHGNFIGSPVPEWRLGEGRTLVFGGVKDIGDEKKYQGQPHDLKAFDELPHFAETQFRYLCGWNRTAKQGQRCRVIATMNPPTSAEEEWVITYFGPWLDQTHPHPAEPGELRWFTTINGKDTEVESGMPFVRDGELLRPLSRTFFHSSVEDNPTYRDSNYTATLQGLPEPLRSKLLYGSFTAGREDNPFQVIPTEWVKLAQQRWRERVQPDITMSSLGIDVARGGRDKTVFTPRFDNYFAEQITLPGAETPNGPAVAARVLLLPTNGATLHVDVIGVGASVFDWLADKVGEQAIAMNAAEKSLARDKSGKLGFVNLRAEWAWKLREALDPDTGDDLAIPPDRELAADLCAPTWKLRANGIQIESKEELVARLGRSPDKGESLILAHAQPNVPGAGIMAYYRGLVAKQSNGDGSPSATH